MLEIGRVQLRMRRVRHEEIEIHRADLRPMEAKVRRLRPVRIPKVAPSRRKDSEAQEAGGGPLSRQGDAVGGHRKNYEGRTEVAGRLVRVDLDRSRRSIAERSGTLGSAQDGRILDLEKRAELKCGRIQRNVVLIDGDGARGVGIEIVEPNRRQRALQLVLHPHR